MCTYILIVNVLAFDFGAIYTVYTGIYEYIQYIQYCTGIDVFHLSNVIVDRDTAVRKNVGGGMIFFAMTVQCQEELKVSSGLLVILRPSEREYQIERI